MLKDIKYKQKFALPFKVSSEVPKAFVQALQLVKFK